MRLIDLRDMIIRERLQYMLLLVVSLAVLAITEMLYLKDPRAFRRFLGEINPLAVFILIVVLGAVLLQVLLSRGFAIYKEGDHKRFCLSFGLAAIFGTIIIIVDSIVRFPVDLNLLFPESLLFYPVIGYLVEILFHVLPLTVLLILLSPAEKAAQHDKIVRISIVIVAVLEPLYQMVFMGSPDWFSLWARTCVSVHIFLINLVQLLIFKQYDFMSMYAFRLIYYLIWHIGWGFVRLRVLY